MREIEIVRGGWDVEEVNDYLESLETDSSDSQGVIGDIKFAESSKECEKHECDLLYDTESNFYYCPLCEK